jgi:hypothetical protein
LTNTAASNEQESPEMSNSGIKVQHRGRRDQRQQLSGRLDQAARILARGSSRRKVLAGIAGAALMAIGLDRAPVAANTLIVVAVGEPCGAATCGHGEYCCNASCGICAPRGGVCTQQYCSAGEVCGMTMCGADEFCCNASCGICAPLGGMCIQVACV